jgi:hypothetical protein
MSLVNETLNIKFRYTSEERLIVHWEKNKPQTILSKFNRDKLFAAYLTPNRREDCPFAQLLLLTNLQVLGLKTVSVKVSCPSLEIINEIDLENVSDADEFSTGGLQLFVNPEMEYDSSKSHTFTFSILATSCVDHYQCNLIDGLLKRELWMNRDQQQHSDTVLIVNSRSYPCHKAILAARSSVFLEKFKTNPNLNQVNIAANPLTTDADVEQFLEFVYTGQFAIKPVTSKQLLLLAKTFEIKTLVELCDYAQREMTMTHLMNLAVLIEQYQKIPIYFFTTETSIENSEFLLKEWYVFS